MSLIFLEAECLGAMEENALVALVLCLLVVLKHYLRRRFDIKTKQDDGNPWTDQVSNQDKSIVEGCKSLHIHQRCRVPTKESSTVLGQREEMARGRVTGASQGKGTKSSVECRSHLAGDFRMFPNTVQYGGDADTTKKGRKKSRKNTKIGHSTFYNT